MVGQPGNWMIRACLGNIYKLPFAFALVVVVPSLAVSVVSPAAPVEADRQPELVALLQLLYHLRLLWKLPRPLYASEPHLRWLGFLQFVVLAPLALGLSLLV
jgi:hypothetical protein